MGPYKSFNLNYVLNEEECREIDTDDLNAAQALLRRLQGALRTNPQVNAFLALDVWVTTDDVDAVTQSIEYIRCVNAPAFVVPFLGHNFGVGEEAGSVLETLAATHGERLIFVYENDVTSAMIRSANIRWDLRVETYETEAKLVATSDGSLARSCSVSVVGASRASIERRRETAALATAERLAVCLYHPLGRVLIADPIRVR